MSRLPFRVCVLVLLLAGCGLQNANDDQSGSDGDTFSMTVPETEWAKSNYCGDPLGGIPQSPAAYRFDTALLNEKLAGDGLRGWIHGAVPSYEQYIFTYRREADDFMAFFDAEQFSLVPAGAGVAEALAGLKRHDQVLLKGTVFENGSPMTHLKVTSIEVLKKFETPTDNTYKFDLAQLQGRTEFPVFGIIHTLLDSPKYGQALILEHGDLVLPIAVPTKHDAWLQSRYRGDIVEAQVKVVEHPHGPPHFELNAAHDVPLKVVDAMVHCHGKETTVEGHLVLFKKSPAISRDVYAVRVVDANGIGRNYTLFPNTDDMDAFTALFDGLSEKAKAAWDGAAEEPRVVRNFFEKTSVKISAKGMLNVVSTEQANAQVYMTSLDDLVVK